MSGGITGAAIVRPHPAEFESWIATPRAMRDWCATAPAGAELVYAVTWALPKHSVTAAHARKLEADKAVALIQRRSPAGLTTYAMRRLRVRRASIGRPAKPKGPVLDVDMQRVLRVLRECARRGEVCPVNRLLQKRAAVTNASYVLQKLVDAHVIASDIVDPASGARVITIIGGASTAWPIGVARR